MARTQHFNLAAFGPEGKISDSGYKFSLKDRQIIDALLYTLFTHDHAATSQVSIAGPTQRPALTLNTSGGTIPPATSLYYGISYVDGSGNETDISTSAYVRTQDALTSPAAPALATATTGGSLVAGTYRYALAYYQTAGTATTRAPNTNSITVPAGTSTNTVTVTLDTPPDGADGWYIYRKGPGDSEYWYLDSATSSATEYVDDGSVTADCTKRRPTTNTTNALNSIDVDIDASDLPLDGNIVSWKIYRTSAAGVWGVASLLQEVVETTTEGGADLVTSFTDTGIATVTGSPNTATAVPPAIPQLDAAEVFASGSSPLPAAVQPRGVQQFYCYLPGTLADSTTYTQVYLPYDMHIERIDAFFGTAPSGVDGSNYVTITVTDDALVDEVQSLYNDAAPNNEVQQIYNTATGGTFTLSFSGQGPTGNLAYNSTALQIKTALELLSNITTVNVYGSGTAADPWVIEFDDPGDQNVAQITADDTNLTGGTSTIATNIAGSDGGTFTLSDGTDTTSAIAYNASAATIETRLETDIASITNVTVTGTGTSSDPWVITFVNPGDQDVDMLIVDDTSLNGTSTIEETVKGHGNIAVSVDCTAAQQYHYWQSATTDFGQQEAEESPATGGVTVSDNLALNDAAAELDTQNETNEWNLGTLEAGDYIFSTWVASPDTTGDFTVQLIDENGPTTLDTVTVTDARSVYTPSYDILYTADGTEDFTLKVTKTDAGAGLVRVDRYQYEVNLPTLGQGQYLTVEVAVTGSPTTNGDDVQLTVWY